MKSKILDIKAAIQIQKPVHDVFEAIVEPSKMSNYFISEGSARIEEGKNIEWKFPEFDERFSIRGGKIEKDKCISFYWGSDDGKELLVEMTMTAKGRDTLVSVTEKSRELDDAGIRWLAQNTEGWANFLACLKAYLEYGINLRKGAFDFMKKQ